MPTAHRRQILANHLRHPPASALATPSIVISIKPHYAELIASGVKQVEFRRRFPRHFQAGQAIFYVTAPVRAMALVARITTVRRASPAVLWDEFGAQGGVTRAAFHAYIAGITTGVALLLEEARMLTASIPLDDARLLTAGFKPPQSVAVLRADSILRDLVVPISKPVREISLPRPRIALT
jgi:predicted transcriptional regulator